ncbi:MAG TPA: hypothetical protein GX506_09170 [Firmicutes bacterium]|nr:hypothetical protein [Bacillota bacterium]
MTDTIIAVIALDRDKVGGQAPIFYADSPRERERLALYLSRITGGVVHDLENGTYIIVRH